MITLVSISHILGLEVYCLILWLAAHGKHYLRNYWYLRSWYLRNKIFPVVLEGICKEQSQTQQCLDGQLQNSFSPAEQFSCLSWVCSSLLLGPYLMGCLVVKHLRKKDCWYVYKILLDNMLNFMFLPKHNCFKATKTTEIKPLKPNPV